MRYCTYLGSVLFKTQWFLSSPKNCTPSSPYKDIKNKKNNVTLYICWLERLANRKNKLAKNNCN